ANILKTFLFHHQINFLVRFLVICFFGLNYVLCEPPKKMQRPVVVKQWPINRNAAQIRANGMMLNLRGSGTANMFSRLPAPGMFVKTNSPFRFAIPMRPNERPIKSSLLSSPSSHVFYKSNFPSQAAALKRPFPHHLPSTGAFKFSSPTHKTAIKFQVAPPVPLKSKPEYVYEKVNVPKFADPIRYGGGHDSAIHTIPAPNLSQSHDKSPIPDPLGNNLNTQFDSDLSKFSAAAFSQAFIKPIHQYQVQENNNDVTIKNTLTGHKSYFAPDNDPSIRPPVLNPIDDPLSTPSDGKPKPADVLYQQNLDFGAAPLVQSQQFSADPFAFPVTSQPQLQQYHLQQSTMMKQGYPLASLNPTYLVMQSNNLLGQHQQHLGPQLFRPENGYIDTSSNGQPGYDVTHSYDYTKPQQVASLGQIYSAQKDQISQLEHSISSTQSPLTALTFIHHDEAASQDNPAYSQVVEPKPNHYQYSHQNFIDLPEEHLSQNDIQNLLNYNNLYQDYYNQRQIENDVILREAQESLKEKLNIQKQQEQTAYDLHQLVQQETYHPLRIVVPDEEHQFQKRIDDEAHSYEEDEPEEFEDDEESNEESNENEHYESSNSNHSS
ncbi:CLUMA_CG005163, isoform A, partial [Clunio marinus]